jgi:hypothetical protein
MNVLRRLRLWRLSKQYVAAWDEWSVEDHELWEAAIADGLDTES